MRSNGSSGSSRVWLLTMLGFAGSAGLTVLLLALLTNIFERKQEGRQPFVRVVEVTEATIDPKVWGQNWPNEYDTYLKTALPTTTKYGGRGPGASDAGPAEQKLDREPWLKRIFAGYAFSIDYRDRRGHYYALFDQEQTKRVTERKQPGACLQCHASNLAAYRFAGKGDVMKGFEVVSGMPYAEARNLKDDAGQPLIQHPIACVDCHDPKTMAVRVTRPGFINGIKALKAKQGIADYDPNRDASRQEMRSFVCGQCHVEYYFKGAGKVVTYPWANGLKVEEIEAYYDAEGFTDFVHAETGDKVLKAQHPEFELWSQGVHARAGVACADCHMPYQRIGAQKVSDHWVRSPLLNINRACQTCHAVAEAELAGRVLTIQDRHYALLQRTAKATTDMLDAIVAAKKAGASEADLQAAASFHKKAQWRLDFVAAENSMGFHAPQEMARILGEAIDFARQGQLEADRAARKR
ncbi:MAG TPA: ammonia-forming cytochrome c nitrite reductase subunit c552 [Verrucomicrobiae bacterium]|jgi:nitrite reductase (cytochrome c-552)|nr:ammonia-forming cytochrome c nitrite reductase subunit c552 [Verrucomicrobiae bacterium]